MIESLTKSSIIFNQMYLYYYLITKRYKLVDILNDKITQKVFARKKLEQM